MQVLAASGSCPFLKSSWPRRMPPCATCPHGPQAMGSGPRHPARSPRRHCPGRHCKSGRNWGCQVCTHPHTQYTHPLPDPLRMLSAQSTSIASFHDQTHPCFAHAVSQVKALLGLLQHHSLSDKRTAHVVKLRLEQARGSKTKVLQGLQRWFHRKLARNPRLDWSRTLAALQLTETFEATAEREFSPQKHVCCVQASVPCLTVGTLH